MNWVTSFVNKILTTYRMFNLDDITTKYDNKDWPFRKLIIGPSGSGETNYLLNSVKKDNNIIDKIYLYAKDLEEPKYQLFMYRSIYDDINDYNKKRQRKVLIVFDDMISHVISNKTAQQVLKELFIRYRKLNISLCFLTQSYFSVPKDVRLNCTHYVIFKLNNKRELQNIAINHS